MMMARSERFILCMVLAVSVMISCGKTPEGMGASGGRYELPPDTEYWNECINNGDYDSLLVSAGSYFATSKRAEDVAGKIYSMAYIVQAYTFMDKYDSAYDKIECLERLYESSGFDDKAVEAIIYNSRAIIAMKTGMDYVAALSNLFKALEADDATGNRMSRWAHLYNISTLYYFKGGDDLSALKYARQAYQIVKDSLPESKECRNNEVLLAAAYLQEGMVDSAFFYSCKARESVARVSVDDYVWGMKIHADILSALGRDDHALSAYSYCTDNVSRVTASTAISVLLSAGDFYYKIERYREAFGLYSEGVRMARESGNNEFTHLMLLGMSKSSDAMGRTKEAFRLYKMYHDASQKVFNIRKEQEFNNLLLDYEQLRHEAELSMKDREIAVYRLRAGFMAFAVILFGMLLLWMRSLYAKKQEMYSKLVHQYDEYQSRTSKLIAAEQEKSAKIQDKMLKLFEDLDDLMKTEKIYRDKNISLESVSKLLGTNSNYVSKAVNKYSGSNFFNYVNNYRLKEAMVLLRSEENFAIKYISDRVGYNSMSAFYRCFQAETACSPSKYRELMKKAG